MLRLVVLGGLAFGIEGVQVGVLDVLAGIPGGRLAGAGPARGVQIALVVEVRGAVVGAEQHVPTIKAAIPRGDQGHRRLAGRQFGRRGRGPAVPLAAGHHEHVRPGCAPRPVRQHERVAVQGQVHQRGAVGCRHRSQVGGKRGHVGEYVHGPEPAGELPRRDLALYVPGLRVHEEPASGSGRLPASSYRQVAIAVDPHFAQLERGERGMPVLWEIGHLLIFGPERPPLPAIVDTGWGVSAARERELVKFRTSSSGRERQCHGNHVVPAHKDWPRPTKAKPAVTLADSRWRQHDYPESQKRGKSDGSLTARFASYSQDGKNRRLFKPRGLTIERTKFVADVDAILEAAHLKNESVREYVRYWAGITGADNLEVVSADDDARLIQEALDAGEILAAGEDLYHSRNHYKDTHS